MGEGAKTLCLCLILDKFILFADHITKSMWYITKTMWWVKGLKPYAALHFEEEYVHPSYNTRLWPYAGPMLAGRRSTGWMFRLVGTADLREAECGDDVHHADDDKDEPGEEMHSLCVDDVKQHTAQQVTAPLH